MTPEDSETSDELIGGLRNALERNQSLESAERSFLNAGYGREKIAIAVAHLRRQGFVVPQKVSALIQSTLTEKKPGFFKRLFGKKKSPEVVVLQKTAEPFKAVSLDVVPSSPSIQLQNIPGFGFRNVRIPSAQLERMLARKGLDSSKEIAAPIYTMSKRPSELHIQQVKEKKPGFFKRLFGRKKKSSDEVEKLKSVPVEKKPMETKKSKPLPKPLPKTLHPTSSGESKPLPKSIFIIMIVISLLILVGAAIFGLYWDQLAHYFNGLF